MVVYYSILAYLLYLGVIKKLSEKYEKAENVIVFVAAFILFFFAAMRSINIGADTRQYCSHFIKLSQTHWRDFSDYSNGYWGDLEFGYKVLNKLLSIFKNRQTITVANSVLQIGLISIVIFKQSSDKWLSFFLYFTLCFYQTALNLTPSSFVSYFLFLSFPYIKDRKPIVFFSFIAIGMLFHTSAIFFLPLYFLYKLPVNKKTILLAIAVISLLILFYPVFIEIITLILPEKYRWYIDNSRTHRGNTVELIVLFVQLLGIVFCLIFNSKEKVSSMIRENNLIVWVLAYETTLYFLSVRASMFQRGAFLFSPYIIIILPNIINHIESEKKKAFVEFSIILYGVTLYLLRVHINNVGTTMPYEFFFSF